MRLQSEPRKTTIKASMVIEPDPIQHDCRSDLHFLLPWGLIFIIGVFLRLYLIDDQIILDDEWHSIDFAMNNSLWYLLTHYSRLGATCIPLNVFCRAILSNVGISEIALITPSLIAGILSLLIFPIILRKIFNDRIAIISTCLWAISPFLIFYSRSGRPYSLYVFFGYLSLILLYWWAATGKIKYAYSYCITGVITIYLHLLAVVVVFSPLLFLILLTFVPMEHNGSHPTAGQTLVKRSEYVTALIGMTALLGLLMGYPLLHSLTSLTSGETEYTSYTITGLISLLSGSTNTIFIFIFIMLLVYGSFHIYKQNKLMCSIFFAVVIGYCCALLLATPTLASMPLILARYVIPVFPICFLIIAVGISNLIEKTAGYKKVGVNTIGDYCCSFLAIAFSITVLLWIGPLPAIYDRPNNFTNHSAFQESYEPINWNKPRPSDFYPITFSRPTGDIPVFYKELASDSSAKKIIEYPSMAGNHFNPFYYYQHFHNKHVLAGFVTYVKLKEQRSKGYILDNYYIDFILGKVTDPAKLKFRNIINIEDMDEVRRSKADYLILHKNIIAEIFPLAAEATQKKLGHGWNIYPAIGKLNTIYQSLLGAPHYEDKEMIVYKLKPPFNLAEIDPTLHATPDANTSSRP